MSTTALAVDPILAAAVTGLTAAQKWLPPWLFYDAAGSALFEQITALPEYYLTRTERAIFQAYGSQLPAMLGAPATIAELGAGSAAKTGVLLQYFGDVQPELLYQPIDISPSALEEAEISVAQHIPSVRVLPQVANYITERYTVARPAGHKVLALYIGSSIGNFSPDEALGILNNLRAHLDPGDALLLGTDLAPSPTKPVATLLSAYDDAAGVTAAFNKNILTRLNRELDADFNPDAFAHRARWNAGCSRIEMHLESLTEQTVTLAGQQIDFQRGETIHTENSRKFTTASINTMLADSGFVTSRTLHDPAGLYAVTLARVR
jgi:dimethylhistidine N-methyltransferase